jgi:outer membrane beta-barrel protein
MIGLLPALSPATAEAADSPGLEAISDFRDGADDRPAVANRFFLKQQRFEISPMFGYVPNNPFARRIVGGLGLGYHFTETLSAQAVVGFSPDAGEGDLKGLTGVLLDRAEAANTNANNDDGTRREFQQPLDKVQLQASFGVAWAPVYGKINLVGETVLNFDFYGSVGIGMISKQNYVAVYDRAATPEQQLVGDVVLLETLDSEVKVSPSVGIGANFFLNQFMAFKIDARSNFYVDNKPQYDPNTPVAEQRLYNNFVASGGLAFFFPKMKPRLYVY